MTPTHLFFLLAQLPPLDQASNARVFVEHDGLKMKYFSLRQWKLKCKLIVTYQNKNFNLKFVNERKSLQTNQ